MKKFSFLVLLLTLISSVAFSQGVTTAGINGKISDNSGSLPGATVVLTEVATGTVYGTITDETGNYHIPNVNVGGPYTLKVTYVGYQDYVQENIYLSLGQTLRFSIELQTASTTLGEVEIVAIQNDIFDGNRTGAATFVDNNTIKKVPTLSGNLDDFTRLTPQANTLGSGISIAGMNNRYNAVFIDGTGANDVFGLASNGMNGGQTGINALSYETVKQFQIMIAPYDIRQSGFAGASINAVTKNGTNRFEGSAYYKLRNESLAGKNNGLANVTERKKLADFKRETYGFSLGGPIIKNKLFFFVNAEKQKDQTPSEANFADYTGDATQAELDALKAHVKDEYGYDMGGYLKSTDLLEGEKFLARIDWNINKNNKLMMRYQYTNAKNVSPSLSNKYNINFANGGVYFPSRTHSIALELKSTLGNRMSNNLKIGYTHTLDDRNPIGENFPRVELEDGNGTIVFGGEVYSTGNQLDQKILTVTDNLQIYSGNHTFTIGTHNEFYSIYNMFMRRAFGYYSYDEQNGQSGIQRFMSGAPADYYRIGYSLVDDIRGDGSAAAADFNFFQLGAYVQDEWQVNEDFKVTAGLRVDVPIYTKDPEMIEGFNYHELYLISKYYDTKGALSGKMPSTQFLFSPRVGFNWDVRGDKTIQVRGGSGIFTSRTPFVWPAGSYTNNGLLIGDYTAYDQVVFNPNWKTQVKGGSVAGSGSQVDLYAKNFKNPQMWRTNIAVDMKLPWDVQGTAELIYTKVINNVLWKDINVKPAWGYATGTPDDRQLYKTYKNGIASNYGQIMLGDNTSKGYTFTFSIQLSKKFNKNINASVSYAYGKARSVFDGTSSQNSSQWNYFIPTPGTPRNEASVGISDFDMGHRFTAFVTWEKEYLKNLKTGISVYYNGQSGQRISYIYDDRNGYFTNEAYKGPQLIYVPASSDEIVFKEDQAQQWADLDAYIKSNPYLNSRRGMYAERNGGRLPFNHLINLKVTQDLYVNIKDRRQTLQLSLDIFNFANLINNKWGANYYTPNNNVSLIKYERLIVDPSLDPSHEMYGKKTLPTFSFKRPTNDEAYSLSDVSSRWQAMLTIRYIF